MAVRATSLPFANSTGPEAEDETGSSLPLWLPRRLLTVPEAAELLQLSVRQLRRLIADGRLHPTRVGRTVRLRPEALAALLDHR